MSNCDHYTFQREVEPYLSGVRLDHFLVKHFRNYTTFRMQRIVQCGLATINGELATTNRRVFAGETVTIRLIDPPDKLIAPEPLPLDIVYEDDWLIVANKPPGMICHQVGRFQTGTLANAVQHHLDEQTSLRGVLRPGIVHRLDRLTSGIIVMTKDHLSHRRLSIQFQKREVRKSYLAIVEGRMTDEKGEIRFPIGTINQSGSILMSTATDAIAPKESHTRYHVVQQFRNHTLVRAEPLTGRLHQIRVHLAAIGHPVMHDEFYGENGTIKASRFDDFAPGAQPVDEPPEDRHTLHASTLQLQHPITNEECRWEAPLPEDMQLELEALSPTQM